MGPQTEGCNSMGTPTIVTGHFEKPSLGSVANRKERFAPADDVYTENPTGAYRGLAFALIFNVLLALIGAAGWILWRVIR